MPTYNLAVDIPQSTIDAIEQASPGKRERLQEIISEDVARYAKNLFKVQSHPSNPTIKVMLNVPGDIGKRVVDLATKRGQARSYLVRQAICDFMHLPARHIDREYRSREGASERPLVGTDILTTTMQAEEQVRAKLYGAANRHEFVHKFLPQWLDKQEKQK